MTCSLSIYSIIRLNEFTSQRCKTATFDSGRVTILLQLEGEDITVDIAWSPTDYEQIRSFRDASCDRSEQGGSEISGLMERSLQSPFSLRFAHYCTSTLQSWLFGKRAVHCPYSGCRLPGPKRVRPRRNAIGQAQIGKQDTRRQEDQSCYVWKENHSLPLILPDFEVNSCLARATAL